ncbi:thiamine-phosphate diphosphorylase [Chitinophaga costaii]|uniref:Thiamine-phosphate diphosphorylase n=2 Tax=Chitinophaga costaii TaxID=1335309 RepID=A0A1C4FLL5_9BACT|nr:thiamine-phosphate diphosphorylase [Chitinophaga costaii]
MYLALAQRVKQLCETYHATFIVNDALEVALACGAHGVHLGLEDGSIAAARTVLGHDKIIGGTANTAAHLQQRVAEGCNYIGLGPLRFTNTKENLSPLLGVEGYRRLLYGQPIPIPVYAIGGIGTEDISALRACGAYGVAVSGVITQATDKKNIVHQFNQSLYGSLTDSR